MQTSLFPNTRPITAPEGVGEGRGRLADPVLIMAVLAFLRARGFETKVDDDGDIFFRDEEGRAFIYSVAAMGHTCQSILFPQFFDIESEEEFARASCVAAQVGAHVQVVKICPFEETVWARVDLFGAEPSALIDIFDDLMHALLLGVRCFCESMEGEA